MSNTFPLLRNCCISCSGLDPKEKSSIHQRVEELGACISFNLTTAVTHVIMRDNTLSSVKYKMAAKVGIPVVSVHFVSECEKEAKRLGKLFDVPQRIDGDHSNETTLGIQSDGPGAEDDVVRAVTEKSRLLPFAGCYISATGVDNALLEDIKHLVANSEPAVSNSRFVKYAGGDGDPGNSDGAGTAHVRLGGGGTYCNALTRRCTHLIAANCASQKFVFAKQWKLHIVSIDWFLDSVKSRFRQDEAMYALTDSSASFSHMEAEYSSLDPPKDVALSADPEFWQAGASVGRRATSAQTLSLGSSILSRNHTATSSVGHSESVDLPRGLSRSPEVDEDDSVNIVSGNHRIRLLTQRCKAASDMGAGVPPLVPYKTTNAQPYRSRAISSDSNQVYMPAAFLENQLDHSSSKDISEEQPDLLAVSGGDKSRDPSSKRRRFDASNDCKFPSTKTSTDRANNQSARYSDTSPPNPQPSAPSENTVKAIHDNIHTGTRHAGIDSGVVSNGVFRQCVFTSLGFTAKSLTILKDIAGANGGHYADLSDYIQQPGNLDRDSLHTALDSFVRHYSNGTKSIYLVVQLCGSKRFEQCYSTAQQRHPPVSVVTECWVEQCIYDGVLYPDFQQIEQQSLSYSGLSQGQHILFRPLPVKKPGIIGTMSLSISGYEDLERDHIGKLATALGIWFSERFSRKATHLVCHPPFKGTKYERALKWGTVVVDSTWIYRLAAATVQPAESVISIASSASDDNGAIRSTAIETPNKVVFGSTIQQDSTLPKQLFSANLTVTPLSKSIGKQNTNTPGRTPIDVSLERNLRRAEENNARSRQPAASIVDSCLAQMGSLSRNKAFEHAGGKIQQSHDDDYIQMPRSHPSRLEYVGSVDRNASSGANLDNRRLDHVLDGVVIALASRIYHRNNELTALALQLGCRVLSRLDTKQTTHLIHQSPREHETLRDYRIALQHNIHVVSPWWLYSCRDTLAHVNEADFPYSYHPERRLRLVSNSPTKKQRHDDAVSPSNSTPDTRLLQSECTPSPKQIVKYNCVPSISRQSGGAVGDQASRDVVSVARPAAIDALFGKKAIQTRRRYRHTQSITPAGHSIDSESEETTSGYRKPSSAAAGPCAARSNDDALLAEKFEEQTTPSNGQIGKSLERIGENVHGIGAGTSNSADGPRDDELSERRKWWLTVESVESTGYQGVDPGNMISQDFGVRGADDLDNMPNTNAAEFPLSSNTALDETEPQPQLQRAKTIGKATSHINSLIEPGVQQSKNSSPLGARNRTMIVYSEDAEAISERDQLIQKLTKG